MAGNVGHIQPLPGQPVLLADRLTAAASPLAAFAGLTVGLLVLRMNRQHATTGPAPSTAGHRYPVPPAPERGNGHYPTSVSWIAGPATGVNQDRTTPSEAAHARGVASRADIDESPLLEDAAFIYKTAAARGEQLSQRAPARTLRGRGHRSPNENLRSIATAIGLGTPPGHPPAAGG